MQFKAPWLVTSFPYKGKALGALDLHPAPPLDQLLGKLVGFLAVKCVEDPHLPDQVAEKMMGPI